MVDFSDIGERERLKPRKGDKPYWQRLRARCYLGFQPSKRRGRGCWFARAYDPDAGKYSRKALGDFGLLSGHDCTSSEHLRQLGFGFSGELASSGVDI